MKDNKPYIEHEIGLPKIKTKIFCLIFPENEEIWIDTQGLLRDALLCAMHDGTPTYSVEVGAKKKEKRLFLPIEWVINDWGGDKEFVQAVKNRKQIIMANMDTYKEMVKNDV